MTQRDFGQEMARLSAAYRQEISKATTAVYYEALGHLAPADLAAAVTWALKSSRFMPSVAELLDRAQHERTTRLRALPPAQHEAIPEWVTEPGDADGPPDVPALIAELLPKLMLADKHVKALRPDQRPGDPVEIDADARAARVEKANAMLHAFHAHNARARTGDQP